MSRTPPTHPWRAVPLALLALIPVGACSPEAGVYAIPRDEAYARLASNRLDELRNKRGCGLLIHILPSASDGETVRWRVASAGMTQLKFSARLLAVDARHTRVVVSVDSKEANGQELYDGDYFTPLPAVRQPIRPSIEEAIGAVLEDRPFDLDRAKVAGGDGVCDVQRANLEVRGIPADVMMRQGARDDRRAEYVDWPEEQDYAY